MKYRVTLRREQTQVVEFYDSEIERDDGVVDAAKELADSADWSGDEEEVDRIAISHDHGATWVHLPISDVLRLERDRSER